MAHDSPSDAWYGDDGAMSRLEDEVQRRGGWSAANNPRAREFVAREVVDGVLPASRVRKWVDTYRTQGRLGLEALDDPTR